MDRSFLQELENSLYIHRPLPLHTERSLEAGFAAKAVTDRRVLYGPGTAVAAPAAANEGEVSEREGVITITAPLRSDHWPEGAPADGDYSNFGTASVRLRFEPQSWQAFHRLRFWARPRMQGGRIAHLNVSVKNVGKIPLPDPYFREGATVFDLKNNQWNECIWEFAAMPRDAVCEVTFYVFLSGRDIQYCQ